MIAAESRLRHGIAGQVLVHAVSLAAGGLFGSFWLFWHSRKELPTRLRDSSGAVAQGESKEALRVTLHARGPRSQA